MERWVVDGDVVCSCVLLLGEKEIGTEVEVRMCHMDMEDMDTAPLQPLNAV